MRNVYVSADAEGDPDFFTDLEVRPLRPSIYIRDICILYMYPALNLPITYLTTRPSALSVTYGHRRTCCRRRSSSATCVAS